MGLFLQLFLKNNIKTKSVKETTYRLQEKCWVGQLQTNIFQWVLSFVCLLAIYKIDFSKTNKWIWWNFMCSILALTSKFVQIGSFRSLIRPQGYMSKSLNNKKTTLHIFKNASTSITTIRVSDQFGPLV